MFPESIEVMPNGKRRRSGDSVSHTSDSETPSHPCPVTRRWKRYVSRWKRYVSRVDKIHAAARRIQYFFARRAPGLDMQIIYRIAEFVRGSISGTKAEWLRYPRYNSVGQLEQSSQK